MSNRDYIIDIPANGSRSLELNEPHFLFLKDCAGKVVVTIDGQSTVMEKGDKKKFDLAKYTRDVAIRRIAVYVNNPDGHAKRAWFISGQGDFEKIVVTGRVTSLAGLLTSEGLEVPDSRKEYAIASKFALEAQQTEIARAVLQDRVVAPATGISFNGATFTPDKQHIMVAQQNHLFCYHRDDVVNPLWELPDDGFLRHAPIGYAGGIGVRFAATVVGETIYSFGRTTGSATVLIKTVNGRNYYLWDSAQALFQLGRYSGMVFNPYNGKFYFNFAQTGELEVHTFISGSWTPVKIGDFTDANGDNYNQCVAVLPPTEEHPEGILLTTNTEDNGQGRLFSVAGDFIGNYSTDAICGGGQVLIDGNRQFSLQNRWNGDRRFREYSLEGFTSYGKIYHYDECSVLFKPVPLTLPILINEGFVNGKPVFMGEIIKAVVGAKIGNFSALPDNYLDFIYGMRWHDGERWREKISGSLSFASAGIQDYFSYNHDQPIYLTVRDGLF